MKIINSALQMQNFWILKFDFTTTPVQLPVVVKDLFESYEVEMDFMIKESGKYRLTYVKVSINKGDGHERGYSIFAEGVTRFTVKDELTRKHSDVNCISIAIQNLRNYIGTVTADGQFGKYVFPTVNLEEMFKEKIRNHGNKNPGRKAIPKILTAIPRKRTTHK